jgi:type II secretory pathway pseudopilin PulG
MRNNQTGQTLIETVVAVFILTMGISAALGLAIYSLGATTNIRQQIIAMGLAREGIEAVKNMRDTNWLRGQLSETCYNFYTEDNTGGRCYQNWLNPSSPAIGYNINPGPSASTYFLAMNINQGELLWQLIRSTTLFGLDVPTSTESDIDGAWYSPRAGLPAIQGSSGFARKITITPDNSFPPFDTNNGPRLKVTVDVWWRDKNCPMTNDVPASDRCTVKLETYLTNWKNF